MDCIRITLRLKTNAYFIGVEYATYPNTLQTLMDEMSKSQFAVLGFSAGLHMLNAIMYAVTLLFCCCYISFRRRHTHPKLAYIGDIMSWFQPLMTAVYIIQHSWLYIYLYIHNTLILVSSLCLFILIHMQCVYA